VPAATLHLLALAQDGIEPGSSGMDTCYDGHLHDHSILTNTEHTHDLFEREKIHFLNVKKCHEGYIIFEQRSIIPLNTTSSLNNSTR
jgi:hypothetical protein